MAEITAQMVKELRELTSAGMMDCKKALSESGGSMEGAIELLRKKGLKDVTKRAGRVAAEGCIYSYIHTGNQIGVMLELNSETDFVARGQEFNDLARTIAMHVAWAKPLYLSREDVCSEVLEKEKDIFRAQLTPQQQNVADKIISGKLEKFYAENVLLEQLDARDPASKKCIGDLITELSAKVGEKIVLKRFVRFEVGEGVQQNESTDE
ncbi:MAG: translation elongation factor Ts [Deltaproteobacteria bacterium]|nr:translation elongation factor Ts [Deltaproteobacteria bacterium]